MYNDTQQKKQTINNMSTNILEYDKAAFQCLIMRTTLSILTLKQTKVLVDEFFFNQTPQFRSKVYNYLYKMANGESGDEFGEDRSVNGASDVNGSVHMLIELWKLAKFILENTSSNIMDDEIYHKMMDSTQNNVENGNKNEMHLLEMCSGINHLREHDEMIRKIGECNITGEYTESTNILRIIF